MREAEFEDDLDLWLGGLLFYKYLSGWNSNHFRKKHSLFVQLCFEKVPDLLALDLIITLLSLVGNLDLG